MPKPSATAFNSAANKMFVVLDVEPPIGLTWIQLATLAGLKPRGGHFNAGRKALLESGLIRSEDSRVFIIRPTAAARATPKARALVELWAKATPGPSAAILRLLEEKGPQPKAMIALELGLKPAGGHWNSAWKRLRDNDLVTFAGDLVSLAQPMPGGAR